MGVTWYDKSCIRPPDWRNQCVRETDHEINRSFTIGVSPCRPQILMGRFSQIYWNFGGFPDAAVVKNPSASSGDAGDLGWIPESGRSPGEGNGNPVQYSCLENSKNRGAWQATVHGVAKSQTWLRDSPFDFHNFWTFHSPNVSIKGSPWIFKCLS